MSFKVVIILMLLAGRLTAQLPQSLRGRLNDKSPAVREKAVRELGAIDPTPELPASALATALAIALKDKEQGVREVAAGFLGSGRPADVAVPALLTALARLEAECDDLRRLMIVKADAQRRPSLLEVADLAGIDSYGMTIIIALEDHWDERAANGLSQVVKTWRIERLPAGTVVRACKALCRYGTRPAIDAVLDTLARIPMPHPPHPTSGTDKEPARRITIQAITPAGPADFGRITTALDTMVVSFREIEKPPGFDPSSSSEWKALMASNAAKLPLRLPSQRPASASRPSPPQGK